MSIDALLRIGLLVVTAKLSEGLLGRLGLSAIVAYALAGVLLGPATGIVGPEDDVQIFLAVGVSVFFFLVGLDELDLPGLKATIRGPYFVGATVSVAISVLASLVVTSDLFGLKFALGLEFNEALAVAGILSLSSLGIVVKVLSDLGLLNKLIGLRIFTAVIIAEVLALLLVGVSIGEVAHDTSVGGVLRLIGQIAGFAVVTWFVSAKVLPAAIDVLQRRLHVSELSFGLLIGSLFLVVAGAERMGLHGSLGRAPVRRGAVGTAPPHARGHHARYPEHRRRPLRTAPVRVCRRVSGLVVHRPARGDHSRRGGHPVHGEVRRRPDRHLPGAAGHADRPGDGLDGQGRR